jgi:hypothetical protein
MKNINTANITSKKAAIKIPRHCWRLEFGVVVTRLFNSIFPLFKGSAVSKKCDQRKSFKILKLLEVHERCGGSSDPSKQCGTPIK